MAKLSKDLSVGTLHPRETLYATSALASLNAEQIVACDGAASFALDVRGTYVGTLTVEGSVDGANWLTIPMRPLNQVAVQYVVTLASAAQGIWSGRPGPFRLLRVRMSAWTSGAATCTVATSTGWLDDSTQERVTPLVVTNTAAVGVAVTLTLPAPGAGLRQYVTYLSINRFATALLTAAATPVLVTTTNLPGTLVFSRPADAAAQGTLDTYREDFAAPIVSSAQNAAVTVVAPATTGVIWRLTGGYYIAP